MNEAVSQMISACEWALSKYLIFSDNVFAPLIYYSHLAAFAASLLVGIFIFINGRKNLANNALFAMVLFFAGWILSDLVLWATEIPSYTIFFWSLINLFEPLVYYFAFYFAYVFLKNRDLSLRMKILSFLPMLPIIFLTPTPFSILGYDITNCDRAAVEGVLAFYGYAVEVLYTLISAMVILNHAEKHKEERKKSLILLFGIIFFLLSFSLGNIVESLTENWYIGQIGLLGAPVFAGALAYLIVRYQSFNIKLLSAQGLIAAIWVMTLSLLFIRHIENVRFVVFATLVLITILGNQLIKSVKREVALREELEVANVGQANLLHIINHQIKGYLTKARLVFDDLLHDEGHRLTGSARPMIEQGFASVTEGVNFVQNFLNASNIEKGTFTYDMKPVDFRSIVEAEADKLKSAMLEKGLEFSLNVLDGDYKMTGDKAQLGQAVKNLIDNSMRYTPHGTVNLQLTTNNGKILFKIQDTGVGISEELRPKLFTKGGRDKDSQKVNVNSTGFGLAFVKGVAEAHKGRVWATSPGVSRGSTFCMELPAV